MRKILTLLLIAIFFGCDDIIEIEDISNRTVTILAPVDNAIIDQTTITFTWESVEDAESYKLQIATPSFAEAIQIVEDTTITGLNFTKTLDYNSYEWRIRAENSGYNTAYTTNQFTIEE